MRIRDLAGRLMAGGAGSHFYGGVRELLAGQRGSASHVKSKPIAGKDHSTRWAARMQRPQPPATDRPRTARMDPSRLAEQGLVRILSGRDRSKASADVSPVDFISAEVEAALRAELGAEPQLPCAES